MVTAMTLAIVIAVAKISVIVVVVDMTTSIVIITMTAKLITTAIKTSTAMPVAMLITTAISNYFKCNILKTQWDKIINFKKLLR